MAPQNATRQVPFQTPAPPTRAASAPRAARHKSAVIVTYHPSYIMRQVGEAYDRIRAQSDADFATIADKLNSFQG